MEAFLVSAVTIALAEFGDRSLLLALVFGLKYRRPWPVFWGMLLGLFLNQLLSAWVGVLVFHWIPAEWQSLLVGAVFLIMAVWLLIPEKEEVPELKSGLGLFASAAVAFFLLEMADKTQLAVIALAGGYGLLWPVVLGATLGILALTAPALWLSHRFADHLPVVWINRIASGVFALLGVWLILQNPSFS